MSQNIGTLITSPLRPNDTLDPIAVIFSQEAKGGHHSYPTYADMLYAQTNYPDRFEFGMLATIYADPTASNNNTYQLQYNYYSISATDSNNWVQYSGIPQTKPIEWQDSVISRTSSIPVPTASNGDRYLITGAVGGTATDYRSISWAGHTDNIATYDSRVNYWNFTFPFEGMTVRADDEKGVIFKYVGIYASGGTWVKEYVNQVYSLTASSSDGINFTAAANLVGYYKPSVFYTRFLTASVGPNMYFNINNLGSASVVKISGTTLQSNIAAGDFVTDLEYQLIWDGTQFQVPFNSSVTNIGNPEFGNTYSGGVYNYPSFQPSTSIGTAIDRFNKILAALVPSPSPNLFTQSATILGSVAKSSFPITGISNFNNNSIYGVAGIDGTIANSGLRLGVFAATTSNDRNKNITGKLNYSVTAPSSGAYPAESFNTFNNTGYLYLVVNGLTVSTATLSNISLTDTTNSLTRPGFILSKATASRFSSGTTFENFYGRTGSYYIPSSSYLGPYSFTASIGLTANQFGFTRGYNNVYIIQDTTTSIITLSALEFVLDDDPKPISVNTGLLSTPVYGVTNSLSGIKYYSQVLLVYSCNIVNAYYNVYSDSGSAIQVSDDSNTSSFNNAGPAPSFAKSSALPSLAANPSYLSLYPYSSGSLSFNSNVRRINDTIGCYIGQVLKPSLNGGLQSFTNVTGASAYLTGLFLDTYIGSSTGNDTTEQFRNELRRLKASGGDYDTISAVTNVSNLYDSTLSLQNTSTELQFFNGSLVYPTINFSSPQGTLNGGSIGSPPYPNPNWGITTADYSGCTGIRYFYRWFYFTPDATYKFQLTFAGTGTIVSSSTSLNTNSNRLRVEVKLPGASSKVTGWLDTATAFTLIATNPLTDGTGCLGTSQTPTTSGSYNIEIGWAGTNISSAGSNGYLLMRISVPQSWSGKLTQISVSKL